jgi:dephospho-CoA kinase
MVFMIVVGLTGGIASGKSTVAKMLADAGAEVVDADDIARRAVGKGRPAWKKIVCRFGGVVLRPDGEIDRPRLAAMVFGDTGRKLTLNRIVHPYVRKQIAADLARLRTSRPEAVVVLDIPLLFEAGMHRGLAEIIVVYAPQSEQYRRLMQRNHLSPQEATARIRSQMPIEEKRRRATVVIDNSGSREHTRRQTLALYRDLKARSGAVSRVR